MLLFNVIEYNMKNSNCINYLFYYSMYNNNYRCCYSSSSLYLFTIQSLIINIKK